MAENVDINYNLNAQQTVSQLKMINTQLMKVTNNLERMNTRASSSHQQHSKAVKNLALRFVGYNLVLNQVMNAQQKLIDFVKESVQAYREFEMRIAEVSTILTEDVIDEVARLEESVAVLSIAFGQSTSDMAKGLYDILSAAFDTEDAINLLNTATKASIAGLSEVRTSVQIFTSVLNAYGMSAEQAAQVSDTLFQSVVRGKFQFEDLESALGFVVPIAAQAGITFEELMAVLSSVTRQGLHLDMAARGVALTIQNVIDPSKQAADAARKYGVEMNGLAIRVNGLTGFFQDLRQASDEFGRHVISEMIPNMRSLRVALVAVSDVGIEGIIEDLALLEGAMGRTDEALKKIQGTSQFLANQMTQEFEQVKRDVGQDWDELVLGLQRGVIEIGKGFGVVVGLFTDTFHTIEKVKNEMKAEEEVSEWLSQFKVTGDMVKDATSYITLLEKQKEVGEEIDNLSKTKFEKQDVPSFGEDIDAVQNAVEIADNIDILNLALDKVIGKTQKFANAWNQLIGNIQSGTQSISDDVQTLLQIEREIADLEQKLIKPLVVGWGAYQQTINGTLNLELERLKASQEYADVQHDVNMGLVDSTYQYKVLNDELQEAVRVVREHEKAQKADREETERLNIAMRELQLQAAKIQLAGMMRRRGLTRSEQKQLKMIQIEQLKLRIQNMETTKQETVEMFDSYTEKKKMIDEFLAKLEEERYQLNYNYDQEIADLTANINFEREKLETRYKWWDDVNQRIINSSADMIGTLEELMEDSSFTELLKDWNIDLEELLANIKKIKKESEEGAEKRRKKPAPPQGTVSGLAMEMKKAKSPAESARAVLDFYVKRAGGNLQFQRGTYFMPETMPILAHRGEQIIPAGRDTPGGGDTIINVQVTGNTITNESLPNVAQLMAQEIAQGLINRRNGKTKYRLF